MSKIGLIISREYKTRVFKKSFILLTFLAPILMVLLMAVPIWLSNIEGDDSKHIIVVDNSGLYQDVFEDTQSYTFDYTSETVEQARNKEQKGELAGILSISGNLTDSASTITFYSERTAQMEMLFYLERELNLFVTDQKIAQQNIPDLKQIMAQTRTSIDIKTVKWTEDGEEKSGSATMALIVGAITAFAIYMFIVIYGAQVMSGVVQEKTNRIVEVIISSVKPFELMMGKIIGIALVGLTQVFLWVALTLLLSSSFNLIGSSPEDIAQISGQFSAVQGQKDVAVFENIFTELADFNFAKILVLFVLYFLGGYLLYASLFAAVGAMVDNETDTNQFSLILMVPIIFALYAAIYSVENPDAPFSFWCSMIPFTSPIVMMVRVPFDAEMWEILLSLAILVLSFLGTTWLAGKIYRTGILMYGKKITWREIWIWLRH